MYPYEHLFGKNYDRAANRKKFEEFRAHTRSIGLGSFFYKCQEYGVIQPGLLFELAKGKTESGFVDRWLFAYPDEGEYPKLNNDQLPKVWKWPPPRT